MQVRLALLSIAAGLAGLSGIASAQSTRTVPAPKLQIYGAGPIGVDNGVKKPCADRRDTGPQVLCVRRERRA